MKVPWEVHVLRKVSTLISILLFGFSAFAGYSDTLCSPDKGNPTECLITALQQFKALGCEIGDSTPMSDPPCLVNSALSISFKNCDWAAYFGEKRVDVLRKECFKKNKKMPPEKVGGIGCCRGKVGMNLSSPPPLLLVSGG